MTRPSRLCLNMPVATSLPWWWTSVGMETLIALTVIGARDGGGSVASR